MVTIPAFCLEKKINNQTFWLISQESGQRNLRFYFESVVSFRKGKTKIAALALDVPGETRLVSPSQMMGSSTSSNPFSYNCNELIRLRAAEKGWCSVGGLTRSRCVTFVFTRRWEKPNRTAVCPQTHFHLAQHWHFSGKRSLARVTWVHDSNILATFRRTFYTA